VRATRLVAWSGGCVVGSPRSAIAGLLISSTRPSPGRNRDGDSLRCSRLPEWNLPLLCNSNTLPSQARRFGSQLALYQYYHLILLQDSAVAAKRKQNTNDGGDVAGVRLFYSIDCIARIPGCSSLSRLPESTELASGVVSDRRAFGLIRAAPV
jgi:hypothetical protein